MPMKDQCLCSISAHEAVACTRLLWVRFKSRFIAMTVHVEYNRCIKQEGVSMIPFPTNYLELKNIQDIPLDKILMEVAASCGFMLVLVFDLDGKVLYANAAMANEFGFKSADDFIGQSMKDIAPAEWIDERLEIARKAIDTNQKIGLLEIFNGNRIFTRFVPIAYKKIDKRIERILIIVENITDHTYQELVSNGYTHPVYHAHVNELGNLDALTAREIEVLALMGQGLRPKEIAKSLFRSNSTILRHREKIGQKLHSSDRSELIKYAQKAVLQVEDAERKRVRFRDRLAARSA